MGKVEQQELLIITIFTLINNDRHFTNEFAIGNLSIAFNYLLCPQENQSLMKLISPSNGFKLKY